MDLPEIKGNHRKFRTLVTSYIGTVGAIDVSEPHTTLNANTGVITQMLLCFAKAKSTLEQVTHVRFNLQPQQRRL